MEKNKLSGNNFSKFGIDIKLGTSLIVISILLIYLIAVIISKEAVYSIAEELQGFILSNFGFVFVALVLIALGALIGLAIYKKSGKIIIGGKLAKPEFSKKAWYSMLFSAGVGIGLVFYGAYEPLALMNSPFFDNASSSEIQGITTTTFHWAFAGFAIYGIIGLALGYFTFNKKLPLAPRTLLYPLIKDKIYGKIGDIFDALTIIATLFGLASSLGLGAMQINAGFTYLFGTKESSVLQIIIIVFITFIATLSILTGLKKGVKLLSQFNIYLAMVLLIITLISIPTLLVFTNILSSMTTHFTGSFDAYVMTMSKDHEFLSGWTIFYWAWWSSWSVFVGMFIAKISVGRTIREYVFAVTVIPGIVAFVWFGTFGTASQYIASTIPGAAEEMLQSIELTLFALNGYIYNNQIILTIVNLLTVVLIFSFFITSSDSGSLVVDHLASGGKLHTTRKQKIFWASMEGLLAITILIIGGSQALNFLNSSLIVLGLPLSIMCILCTILFVYQLATDIKNDETCYVTKERNTRIKSKKIENYN